MKTLNNTKALRTVLMAILTIILTGNLFSQPNEDWVANYNGFNNEDKPSSMVMDKNKNIYITGSSEDIQNGKDILTVKYSHEGKELWTARFSGRSNIDGNDDAANSIIVDLKGNVYVTGYTHGGFRGRDYCTIKYNNEGVEQWVKFYSVEGDIEDSDEEAIAIATDNSGNVFVTGNSNGRGAAYETFTIKYNTRGDILWKNTLRERTNSENKPSALSIDNEGNALLTGYIVGVNSSKDFLTVKYNSNGDELWMQKYNGIGGNVAINDDEAKSMTIDKNNNVFVTGYSYGAGTGKDFCVVKYSSKGQQEWVSRIDNMKSNEEEVYDDEPSALTLDNSGNIFVTGKSISPTEGGSDFLTVKIDSKGVALWSMMYDSPQFTNTDDAAEAIAIDNSGNVIVTGYCGPIFFTSSCGRGKRFCTIKYITDGEEKWVKEYAGRGVLETSNAGSRSVITDEKGRIFVMGEVTDSETGTDYCLISYSEKVSHPIIKVSKEITDENKYRLNNNYPNPFNPSTKISFTIPNTTVVKLVIYDITGKEVTQLVNSQLEKGSHQFEWNAAGLTSGTYFYKIQTEGFTETRRMLLIK
ncbi:MAG: SBBP repeat-containing protein [Ignavibacteria bacterium]|nr:SBBP repeat-containing protein [Ignavibacteria bacterium]